MVQNFPLLEHQCSRKPLLFYFYLTFCYSGLKIYQLPYFIETGLGLESSVSYFSLLVAPHDLTTRREILALLGVKSLDVHPYFSRNDAIRYDMRHFMSPASREMNLREKTVERCLAQSLISEKSGYP